MLKQVSSWKLLFHELDYFSAYLIQLVMLRVLLLDERSNRLSDFFFLVKPAFFFDAKMK